jgi:hypothetical protein
MIFRDQYIFFKREECKRSFFVLRKCRNVDRLITTHSFSNLFNSLIVIFSVSITASLWALKQQK